MLTINPKNFWHVINPKSNQAICLEDADGSVVSDLVSCNIFNSAFASVFVDDSCFRPPLWQVYQLPPMCPINITPNGVVNVIENMKLSSACGFDGINVKMLKNTKAYEA